MGVEAQLHVLEATPPRGEEVVDGDAIPPRRARGVASEGADAGHHLDEDLLNRVLGVLRVPEHAQREVVERGGDSPNEIVEGGRIARASFLNQALENVLLRSRRQTAR